MARVLVVDDQAANRDLLVTLLKYAGHEPLEAADGHLALVQALATRPQLVICDLLMPTMDGYEFVRQLRAEPTIARTEVIFYTATFLEREARSLAQSCGVSRVLIKPTEPEEILRVIAQALQGAQSAEPVADTAEFDREHLRLLTDKLALKVNELESANQRLSALTDLNLQLASEHDPHVMLDKVCRGARDLLGARAAVLAVRDKNDHGLTHVSCWGLAPGASPGLQDLAADAGLPGQVMADGRARRFANPDGAPASAGLPAALPALHHGLIAAICSPEQPYGWVLLMDKLGADGFTPEDEHILSIYAAQAGRIYENGSLYKKIKRTADQLQLANETLEQRVLQRTAELREVIDGLESFNRGVSHDLRGPLGGIASAARLAQEFIAQHDTDRALRFLQVIADQAETTRQLVDAMLALARASDTSLSREPVDMGALAAEVVASLQRLHGDAPLPVVIEPLAIVDADRKLVRQVLVNLIGNALKFSAGAMPPLVRVGMDASGRTPVFFVRDNGVGFDAGRAPQLFKPFQRLHGAGFEGSGVGLSIVRKIVERHGGRVWADSTPGQGATFHFSLGAG